MECIDCIEAVARLHLYLDRELNTEEITIVQQHLANCPHCECRFHVDTSVKRLIHEHCRFARAPEHLRITVMRLAHMSSQELDSLAPDLKMEIKADIEG